MRAKLANLNPCAVPFLSRCTGTCAGTAVYYVLSLSAMQYCLYYILIQQILTSAAYF